MEKKWITSESKATWDLPLIRAILEVVSKDFWGPMEKLPSWWSLMGWKYCGKEEEEEEKTSQSNLKSSGSSGSLKRMGMRRSVWRTLFASRRSLSIQTKGSPLQKMKVAMRWKKCKLSPFFHLTLFRSLEMMMVRFFLAHFWDHKLWNFLRTNLVGWGGKINLLGDTRWHLFF